ncbi:MAG: HNH endonuclease [Polyangiaceae bacterium]|nr:HNH endonuclease [Polyangiaceae bacterium]
MVPLVRGAPPRILREKADEWSQRYLEDCQAEKKPRPRSDRYGHPEVRAELARMSHGKCFYCELKMPEKEAEVDHHVEVEERRDLAFTWSNLYLACERCNAQKADNQRSPVNVCVDPCDGSQKPADHLSYEAEQIVPRDERGRQTVAKYRLDRDDLDLKRARLLIQFAETREKIRIRMIAERREEMTEEEREILRLYGAPSRPFSLMMNVYLSRAGL